MRKRNASIILATFAVALSTHVATEQSALGSATYQGSTDNWSLAANWNTGSVPLTTSISATPWNQRMNVNSSAVGTGISLTYTASLGTLVLGEGRAFAIGSAVAGSTVFNLTGGTIVLTGSTVAGVGSTAASIIGANGNGNSTTVNVSGGLLNLTTAANFNGGLLAIGFAGGANAMSATLNITGTGVVRANQVVFNGNNSATGNLNANVTIGTGGTLQTSSIRMGTDDVARTGVNATVTFNGGTFIASGTNGSISANVSSVVNAGGATFQVDSSTFSVNKNMTGGGGLTKTGNGTLTLASQSYTGPTAVNGGILNLPSTAALTSAITVGTNARLIGEGSTTGGVTFAAGSRFTFDPTTTGANQYFRSSGNINTTAGATTKIVVDLSTAISSGTGIVVMEGASLTTNGASDFQLNSRGTLSTTSTQVLFNYSAGNLVWKGGNGTNPTFWDTNVTASNFTLGGTDDFFLNGDNVTFDDTALNFSPAVQAALLAGSVTFNNSTDYTLSGSTVTASSLTKNGSGRATISNTIDASATINSGTLQLGNGSGSTGRITGSINNGAALVFDFGANTVSLAATTNLLGGGSVTKNGSGILELTGTASTFSGTTTINAGVLRFNPATSINLDTTIDGAGSLEKSGSGSVLTIDTPNTYGGLTRINSGSLLLTPGGALGSTAGATTVSSAATLGLGGDVTIPAGEVITVAGTGVTTAGHFFTGSATQRGALQGVSGSNNIVLGDIVVGAATGTRIGVQDGASLELAGNITEAAPNSALTFRTSGSGVVLLSGNNTITGETAVLGTTVRLGSDTGFSAGSVLSIGTALIGQSRVDLSGRSPTVAGLSNNGGLGADAVLSNDGSSDSVLTVNASATHIFPGVIQDGPTNKISLVKTGSGIQALNGANTYTGPTSINVGQLSVNGSLTSAITVATGATLAGEGSTTAGLTLAAGSTLSFNPTTTNAFTAGGVVDTSAGATTKINIRLTTPALSGTGIVVVQGASINGAGASDFNLIGRGSLSVVGNQVLYDYGVGNLVWKGGNTTSPTFWDVNTTTQNFTLFGADDVFFGGDNVLFDDTALNFNPAVQANLTAGTLSFNSFSNSYTISGANVTSTGLTKNGSTLVTLANNNTVNGLVAVNAGTLQFGNGGTTGTLTANAGVSVGTVATLAFDYGTNAATASVTGGISGNGAIVKNGTGRLVLASNTVANTGSTTINGGTLAVSFSANGVNQTYGGPIGGAGAFEKTGLGVLTLNLANSYAGPTTVTGGVLRIANSSSLDGTSGVAVDSATTLALADGVTISKPITLSGPGSTVTYSGTEFAAVQRGALQGGSGTSTYAGNITIAAQATRIGIQDGAMMTVSGKITDGANDYRLVLRTGPTGKLILSNPLNDWSGGTDVLGMGVQLGATNAISTQGDLRIGTGGIGASVLDLNGHSQSVTSIWEFGGEPTNVITNTAAGQSILTINGGLGQNYSSIIAGNIAISKAGAGAQLLSGTLVYSGDTTVTGGALNVNAPLRPVTGSLVVTGPGAATLGAAPTPIAGSGYTVAAEVASISITAGGSVTVNTVDRTLNKASVLITSGLTISGGVLDLGTSDMVVKGGAANLATLGSYVATYLSSGGTAGLGSSVATPASAPYTTVAVASNGKFGLPLMLSFDGVAVDATDALVKYTYVGDTDLSGTLDARDFNAVLNGFSNGLSGWENGDVNYDGIVNSTDWSLFLTAYTWYGSFGTPLDDTGNGGATIPEPAALGLLAAAAPLAGRRRRR